MQFEANNFNAEYYSREEGHFECRYTSLDGTLYVYEWRDYLPSWFLIKNKHNYEETIYSYDKIEVNRLNNLSSYTLLEEQ